MRLLVNVGLLLSCSIGYSQQTYYDVTAGNGYGIRLWQSENYKIHMGNSAEYLYGPVTDYSIKMNSNSTPGRGWTWGMAGIAPIAALNNAGDMQIAGSFFAGKIGIGTSSPAGGLDVRSGSAYAIRTLTSNRYVIEVRNVSDAEGGWWLVNDPNGSFALHENGVADRFTIAAGGNVGIGTATPEHKLDVFGPENNWKAKFHGSDGYILMGPANPYWAHIYTDRPAFLFNQNVFSYQGGFSSYNTSDLFLQTGGTTRVTVLQSNGNVGINSSNPTEKLTVNGTIYGKEVKVNLSVPGPDYVFADEYRLRSLEDVEAYIKVNSHLPEVPSAKTMEENGIKVGEMNVILLKKIEELTLYVIELKKENGVLRGEVLKKIQALELNQK